MLANVQISFCKEISLQVEALVHYSFVRLRNIFGTESVAKFDKIYTKFAEG
jgi:hypothetical protein